MNDRELIGLAAKAGGVAGQFLDDDEFFLNGDRTPDNDTTWNPLRRDGDAFRLAVKLCMNIEVTDSHVYACTMGNCSEPAKPDRDAAVRRAIVRAAAEIGRTMP